MVTFRVSSNCLFTWPIIILPRVLLLLLLVVTQTYFVLLFFQGVVTNYVGLVNRLGMTGQYTRIHQEVEKETRPFDSRRKFFLLPVEIKTQLGSSSSVSCRLLPHPASQGRKEASRVAVWQFQITNSHPLERR